MYIFSTLEKAKQVLGVSDTKEDALITELLSSVSALVFGYINFLATKGEFWSVTLYNPTATKKLYVPVASMINVKAVYILEGVNTVIKTIDSDSYNSYLQNINFNDEIPEGNINLLIAAGWTVGTTRVPRDDQYDIVLAFLLLVKEQYELIKSRNPLRESTQTSDGTIESLKTENDRLIVGARNMLNRYRIPSDNRILKVLFVKSIDGNGFINDSGKRVL